MVTKHIRSVPISKFCSVLAKIHMVTKRGLTSGKPLSSSVLAKIHMVTKPQKYGSTFLNVIEY